MRIGLILFVLILVLPILVTERVKIVKCAEWRIFAFYHTGGIMLTFLWHYIYTKNLTEITFWFFLLLLLWWLANFIFKKNKTALTVWKVFNGVVFFGLALGILCQTVINRGASQREWCFIPFYSFVTAKENVEIYRSMLMNVFLFVPFGFTLAISLPERLNKKILIVVLSAIAFSLFIEFLQFVFSLGRTEVDDVLCNGVGAFVGALPCIFHFNSKGKKI